MPPLKEEFEKVDLPTFKNIAGNAEAFRSVQDLESWAKEARQKLANHISENREKWLNEAREKVALDRQKQAPQLNPPNMPRPSIEQEAQRLVGRRAEALMAEVGKQRQAQLEEITNTPGYDPKREAQNKRAERAPAHPLKKSSHSQVDRVSDTRNHVERHFHKMKSTWIEQARARGSEDPVAEVYRNYWARKDNLRKAHHRLIDRSFKEHGIDRATPERPTPPGPSMSS